MIRMQERLSISERPRRPVEVVVEPTAAPRHCPTGITLRSSNTQQFGLRIECTIDTA